MVSTVNLSVAIQVSPSIEFQQDSINIELGKLQQTLQEQPSSTNLLAKSFVYGVYESSVQEIAGNFENLLHNAVIKKGVSGITSAFKVLGNKT